MGFGLNVKITFFSLMFVCTFLQSCHAENSRPIVNLKDARLNFKTVILPQEEDKQPAEKAPIKIFKTIKYPSANGLLTAYVTPKNKDGKKRPAIIWIQGGDSNSLGNVWENASKDNDQTAGAYREAGIVMMFPSLRGGNDNPGVKEGFYGEVDDVLSAFEYLKKLDYVDPRRIYLGGHSTGGTLSLLVSESPNQFRAIFSFGPVEDVEGYGYDSGYLPFDVTNKIEFDLRKPMLYLNTIQTPTWIIEGEAGNVASLREMRSVAKNPLVHFIEVINADHFSTLAPINEFIAQKILQDFTEETNIYLEADEIMKRFKSQKLY